LLLVGLLGYLSITGTALAAVATLLGYWPRIAAARRFHHPRYSVLLHPLGVLILLVLQWNALMRQWRGIPAQWKGRDYGPGASGAATR